MEQERNVSLFESLAMLFIHPGRQLQSITDRGDSVNTLSNGINTLLLKSLPSHS